MPTPSSPELFETKSNEVLIQEIRNAPRLESENIPRNTSPQFDTYSTADQRQPETPNMYLTPAPTAANSTTAVTESLAPQLNSANRNDARFRSIFDHLDQFKDGFIDYECLPRLAELNEVCPTQKVLTLP